MKKSISRLLPVSLIPTRCGLAMAVVLLGTLPANAQKTWDGNGNGKNKADWSTAGKNGNWSGAAAPSSTDALIFGGTNQLTTNTNDIANLNPSSITFDNTAGAFTLAGNLITLGGSLTNNSANTQTINLATALSATRTFDAASGNLVVGDVISSTGGLTKTGGQTLTLSGTNTFSGQLTVSQGTLAIGTINNASANGTLGNSSLGVILGSSGNTGTLQYTGGTASSTKGFTLATSGTGAFDVTTGATTLTLSGVVTGSGALTKLGAGTLTLSGTNTYTGTTTVNAGTLRAGAAAGGQAFGNLSAVTMANTAGATLELNGFDQTIGSLAGGGTTGGNVAIGGATLTFGGDNSSTLFGGAFTGTGNLTKVGNGTFTVTSQVPSLVTITISAGTFQIGNGGTTGQTTSPSTVINNATYVWDRSTDITHGDTSVISGTGVLVKRGSFTFTMNSTNSYSGGTVIDAGTIALNNALALGSTSGALTVNTGGTLNLNNFGITVGNLTGTGGTITSTTAGSRTLTIGQGNTGGGDYQGVIANGTGTTALTKVGTGTITFSGANTYTGLTTVNAGTLQIGNGGTTGSLSTSSSITNNGTLAFSRTNTITQGTAFASVIAGTGGVTKLSSGTLVLNGTNTFTGPTTVSAGTLQAGAAGGGQAFGNLSAVDTANVASAVLDLNNFSQTIGSLAGGGTTGGNVSLGSATLTTGGNNTSTTYGGVISGSGSLIKSGSGTFALTGASTYSGGTTVSGGTLRANNSSGSATGTGAVAVNAGGTLGGTGSIAGALSINAGGTLSPGASIETLSSGPLTFNNDSTFEYEVDSSVALGVAADLLLVSGNLTNSGTVNLALADIAASPVAFAHNTTFTLINYSGTWNGGLFTVDGNAIADGGTFTAGLNTWHLYYTATTGGSNFAGQYVHANYVNVVALPEPGTIVLLVAGGLAGLMLRRRIRR